jgi:hypothetical protein
MDSSLPPKNLVRVVKGHRAVSDRVTLIEESNACVVFLKLLLLLLPHFNLIFNFKIIV